MVNGDKSKLFLILEFVGPQLRSDHLPSLPKAEYSSQQAYPYIQSSQTDFLNSEIMNCPGVIR